jgi:type IV pilus assembly protein PilC
MSTFQYTAKDAVGNTRAGIYTDIESIKALRQELAKMGYKLIKARRERKNIAKKVKIAQSEIVAFAYEFSGMYGGGLSIIRCLDTIESQVDNLAFKAVIADVKQDVEAGLSLTEAFKKHTHIFSDFFIGMIQAGETGSKLGETLHMSAQYLEKQAEMRNKIKSAFVYPVTVVVMCFFVVTALVLFVVPVFQKLYAQLHITLPIPTLILICISDMVRNYWMIIVPSVIAAVFTIRHLYRMPSVREKIDAIKINMPVFGKINRMVVASRFTRTLAMMLSSGVAIVEAIELSKQVADNSVMRQHATEMQEKIMTGSSLSEPMSQCNILPPMIQQLAGAGEESGTLPEMLQKGVDFLDVKFERAINALLVKIEPILSVVLGLVVGMILLGVYLPMFDYMGHVK